MWNHHELLKNLSSGITQESVKDYASRMLSWFCFAGLLEVRQGYFIAIPIHPKQGKQKGKILECEFSRRKTSKFKIHSGQLSFWDLLE